MSGRRGRAKVRGLETVPLRWQGSVPRPPGELAAGFGGARASAVGVGPSGELAALWRATADGDRRGVVVSTTGEPGEGSAGPQTATVLDGLPDAVRFVQPMPDGEWLLSAARVPRGGGRPAGVWGQLGRPRIRGSLGDAIEHVLSTPSGQIWVGYFDEAQAGGGPTGVARFEADLTEAWRYDPRDGLPDHLDCYALNVNGETATSYAYTAWHLTRIVADSWQDLGAAPHTGAHVLLLDGTLGALVGGYDAERDVVVPLALTGAGVTEAGPRRRLVLPGGLDLPDDVRYVGRGSELHVIDGADWYRLDLADLGFAPYP